MNSINLQYEIKSVKRNQVTEHEHHKFCVDASELRLPPGQYPRSIATDLGNGQPFNFVMFGSQGTAIYRQGNGCIELHVLND